MCCCYETMAYNRHSASLNWMGRWRFSAEGVDRNGDRWSYAYGQHHYIDHCRTMAASLPFAPLRFWINVYEIDPMWLIDLQFLKMFAPSTTRIYSCLEKRSHIFLHVQLFEKCPIVCWREGIAWNHRFKWCAAYCRSAHCTFYNDWIFHCFVVMTSLVYIIQICITHFQGSSTLSHAYFWRKDDFLEVYNSNYPM